MRMVKAKNLSRTYVRGEIKVKALKKANIEIEKGEFVAVMGPSGSGKSTLLHLLGLLDKPTAGELFLHRFNIQALSDLELTNLRLCCLGYVFQEYSLISELTAIENVSVPARMFDVPLETYVTRSAEMLRNLGLGDRLHHYPSELSGGEQQRVAIARALINQPMILFADEPTANLDSKNAKMIVELFSKINNEINQTIVMVTHEKSLGRMADRIIYLKDGKISKRPTV